MIARRVWVVSLAAVLGIIVATGGSALAQQEVVDSVTVETCSGETIELNGNENRMLDLHNHARADNGLWPLCVHPVLTEAARAHSQEMLDKGYFSHDSPDGETPETRLERLGYDFAGYSYWTYGENIGWGAGEMGAPEHRFDEWMSSDEHRGNILSEDFSEIGIGARTGTYGDQSGATMYTVTFGTRR